MNFILEQVRLKYANSLRPSSNSTHLSKIKFTNDKARRPLKCSQIKQTSSTFLQFESMYKISQKNKNSTPKLPSIQMTKKNIDLSLRRSLVFTDPDYSEPFKFVVNHMILKPKIFALKKKRNIIEYLDNGNIMMSYLHKKDYQILNDNYTGYDSITFLKSKISSHIDKYNMHQKTTSFYTRQFPPKEIKLSLISISFEFINSKNESNILYLPLCTIPFYYSISDEIFYLFITKIVDISNEINEIKINNASIIKYINEIYNDIDMFGKNSKFYSTNLTKQPFDWLTDKEHYKIIIRPPQLEIKQENVFTFRKLVGKGLMCKLLENNYENWDILSLCYLSSFKNFRNAIGILYGKKVNSKICNKGKFYDVDEELNEINKKPLNDGTKSNTFSFFTTITQDMMLKNFFFTFFSYTICVELHNITHCFNIPFENMKFLFDLKSKYNIQNIIKKCLFIKEEKPELNLNLLKDTPYDKLDNFFSSNVPKNKELIDSSFSELTIKVQDPRLEWRDILSVTNTTVKDITSHNYCINTSLLDQLLNSQLKEWPPIFNKYSDELGKEVDKKYNRRLSVMKTMKM